MKGEDVLSIASFLGSVLLVHGLGGLKATHSYLLVVLVGVLLMNVNRFTVRIESPEIMKGGY